jgi:hypothetical protein
MKLEKLTLKISLLALIFVFSQCNDDSFIDEVLVADDAAVEMSAKGGKDGSGGGGPSNGDLYGDLYQIERDDDGVPVLLLIDGTYYVQPFDIEGLIPFEIGEDGELEFEREPIEVEISRLNIVRAPDRVLDNAMKEVIAIIVDHYVIFDHGGRIMGEDNGEYTTVESPLANMAVYKEIMPEQTVGNLFNGALDVAEYVSDMQLAASCLAGATNKESTMTIDQLVYFNTFAELFGDGTLQDDAGNSFYNYGNFEHSRDIYDGRWVEVIVGLNPEVKEIKTINEFMGWQPYDSSGKSATQQFLDAVNDATHVLYEVHESSLVTFLPEYEP